MTEFLQSSPNNNTAELPDELAFEREEFLAHNAPDKSFFELDEERRDAVAKTRDEDRARALAKYAKLNSSFNGYAENID